MNQSTPALQIEQFLQDIQKTNKLMKEWKKEPDIIGKINISNQLYNHWQNMSLSNFFRSIV